MTADARFWDRIAPKYANAPIRDLDAYRYTLERTRSYLKGSDRVLELGCGTGSTAIALAASAAEITATDLSEGMLKVGRERAWNAAAANVDFRCCGVLDAPEGPFDAVMAFNLLHLLPDLEAALASIAAKLPAGGLFISKTPCLGEARGSWKYWMYSIAIPLMRLAGKAPGHVDFLDIRTLEAAVQRAGFEIIETGNYPADTPGRYLVARRR
ncbi:MULTISPECIES: class I SAM-dependent methyltransferase [Leisingera]|jgi:ubiquinone/menaquinone biosynthesis C-methylase UbiE|uniref:class I SAM-dependent methyltransferase n=1 Tax=Leisingera TaxID=191028 RepID=UPI001150108D|nr:MULTISPECIES: class I SAM-dependent methyltransferase [Leisingera]QDI76894.1 class I SAM-dependent methyltransferase [Leisingera aquaemixtae]